MSLLSTNVLAVITDFGRVYPRVIVAVGVWVGRGRAGRGGEGRERAGGEAEMGGCAVARFPVGV